MNSGQPASRRGGNARFDEERPMPSDSSVNDPEFARSQPKRVYARPRPDESPEEFVERFLSLILDAGDSSKVE